MIQINFVVSLAVKSPFQGNDMGLVNIFSFLRRLRLLEFKSTVLVFFLTKLSMRVRVTQCYTFRLYIAALGVACWVREEVIK